MKSSLLLILSVLLSGCGLTNITYHSVRLASKRSAALTREQVPAAIELTTQGSHTRTLASSEHIVVLSHQVAQNTYSDASLNPALREQIESILLQGLLAKGYRSASRLNLRQVLQEQAFPTGRLDPAKLRGLFKGSIILLCTVKRADAEPAEYRWSGGDFGSDGKGNIGTRFNFDCSAELLDADTSESLWVATARLDCVLRRGLATGAIFDEVLRRVAQALPGPATPLARAPTPEQTTVYAPAIQVMPGQTSGTWVTTPPTR